MSKLVRANMPGVCPIANREVKLFITGFFFRLIRFKFIKQTDAANSRGRASGIYENIYGWLDFPVARTVCLPHFTLRDLYAG